MPDNLKEDKNTFAVLGAGIGIGLWCRLKKGLYVGAARTQAMCALIFRKRQDLLRGGLPIKENTAGLLLNSARSFGFQTGLDTRALNAII